MTSHAPAPQAPRGGEQAMPTLVPGPGAGLRDTVPPPVGIDRGGLLHGWAAAWWSVVMVLLGLLTGPVALVLCALVLAGLFSLPAVGTGLLLLVPAIWGTWLLGRWERHRVAAFTGVDVGPAPVSRAPTWRRVLGADEPRLRALGWAGLHSLWGLLSGSVVLLVLTLAAVLATLPLYAWALPEQGLRVLGLVPVGSGTSVLLAWVAGTVLLVLAPVLSRGLGTVDVNLARWLLGTDPQRQLREMSRRVQTLTTTRTEAVDSVEAERRRIERDLHDGPQQRLVSIAMTLGLARDALDRDPATVRPLLEEAHASSKEAIIEMRQVARGIVPPILTDRGLDAAVSALAARSPVPVTVTARLPRPRLDPTVEAIAYFCVSEALTNVAKHAQATHATVDLGTNGGPGGEVLTVVITDDGRGGAVVGGGTGLTGLRQRVAGVDGSVQVHSPAGAGTTVTIVLPLRPGGGAR